MDKLSLWKVENSILKLEINCINEYRHSYFLHNLTENMAFYTMDYPDSSSNKIYIFILQHRSAKFLTTMYIQYKIDSTFFIANLLLDDITFIYVFQVFISCKSVQEKSFSQKEIQNQKTKELLHFNKLCLPFVNVFHIIYLTKYFNNRKSSHSRKVKLFQTTNCFSKD